MSTITTGGNDAIGLPSGGKLFYAKGLWWLFYASSTNSGKMCYVTNSTASCSTSNFSSQNIVQSGGVDVTATSGLDFQVVSDGNYIHYAYCPVSGTTLYYRRGMLNSDGTITWTSDNVNTNLISNEFKVCSIALDSTNHILIGYYGYTDARVARNANTNGTWSNSYGTSGKLVSDEQSYSMWCQVIPLTNNKWYLIYGGVVGGNLYGKLWNGSTLSSLEQVTYTTASYTMRFSATSVGDDIYMAYNANTASSNYNLYVNKRTYGAGTPWGSTVIKMLVDDVVGGSYASNSGWGPVPAITANKYSNKIYVCWLNYPTSSHAYYRIYDITAGTWSPLLTVAGTDAATETGFTFPAYIVTCNRESNDRIIVLYPTTSEANYLIKGYAISSPGFHQNVGPGGGMPINSGLMII